MCRLSPQQQGHASSASLLSARVSTGLLPRKVLLESLWQALMEGRFLFLFRSVIVTFTSLARGFTRCPVVLPSVMPAPISRLRHD